MMLLPEVLLLSKSICFAWLFWDYMFLGLLFFPSLSLFGLLWWFCAAAPFLLPVLTPHCPPGQGGLCPHGTFQTSCGTGGEPRLVRTGWPTCGLGPPGGPGPPSWAASSWQCQPWRRDGWVRDRRETVRAEYEIWFSAWGLITSRNHYKSLHL